MSSEVLKALIYEIFNEADDDQNAELDMDECRGFIKKLMRETYPRKSWEEERFRNAFFAIDKDKQGTIGFEEIFLFI